MSMNRQQRRELDRQAKKSIEVIQSHLDFLNAAGNPKYKVVVQSDMAYKAKMVMRRMMFWR